MRIIIDGRWLGRTGIGRYVEELLRELQQLDTVNEYVVLMLPDKFATWRFAGGNFEAVLTEYDVYTWQEQLLLGGQIARLKPDLVHFTSFDVPMFYPGRFVTTVHDLTLVNFKNVRGEGLQKLVYNFKYGAMRQVLRFGVTQAARVIVPTEYVRGELVKLFPGTRRKVVVTNEAVSPAWAEPAGRFKTPEEFVLYVGNYYPYKNVGRLVEAFARSEARKRGVKLVLNGKPDYFQDLVRAKAQELGVAREIVWPGRTSDAELAALYKRASVFVLPSLSEGFGLPALEAMAYGTPTLSSNASCMPEVYGEAVDYFDPLDVEDIARKIDALLGDKKRQDELRKLGPKQVGRYSWRRMAEETLEVYKKAA